MMNCECRGLRHNQRSITRHSAASEFSIHHFTIHNSSFIIHNSSVYLAEHNINGADDGYYVGDQVSAHHSVESLEVHERRRTHPHAVRAGGPVAHYEVA